MQILPEGFFLPTGRFVVQMRKKRPVGKKTPPPSDKISKFNWHFVYPRGSAVADLSTIQIKKNKGLHKGKLKKKFVRRLAPNLNNLPEFNGSIRIF